MMRLTNSNAVRFNAVRHRMHANATAPHYREGVGVLDLSVQRLYQCEVSPDPRGRQREHTRVEVQGQLELRISGLQRNTDYSDILFFRGSYPCLSLHVCNCKIINLIFQNHYLQIIILQVEAHKWKHYINSSKKRSMTTVLHTKQWGLKYKICLTWKVRKFCPVLTTSEVCLSV